MMSGPFLEGRCMDNKAINGRSSDLSSLSSTFPHALQNNVLAVAHIRQMKLERVKGGLTAAGLYAIFTRFPFNGLCPTVICREVTHCEGKDQRFVPSFLFEAGWGRGMGEAFVGDGYSRGCKRMTPDCKRVQGHSNSKSSHISTYPYFVYWRHRKPNHGITHIRMYPIFVYRRLSKP